MVVSQDKKNAYIREKIIAKQNIDTKGYLHYLDIAKQLRKGALPEQLKRIKEIHVIVKGNDVKADKIFSAANLVKLPALIYDDLHQYDEKTGKKSRSFVSESSVDCVLLYATHAHALADLSRRYVVIDTMDRVLWERIESLDGIINRGTLKAAHIVPFAYAIWSDVSWNLLDPARHSEGRLPDDLALTFEPPLCRTHSDQVIIIAEPSSLRFTTLFWPSLLNQLAPYICGVQKMALKTHFEHPEFAHYLDWVDPQDYAPSIREKIYAEYERLREEEYQRLHSGEDKYFKVCDSAKLLREINHHASF